MDSNVPNHFNSLRKTGDPETQHLQTHVGFSALESRGSTKDRTQGTPSHGNQRGFEEAGTPGGG